MSGNSLPTFRDQVAVLSSYQYSLRNNPEQRSSYLLRDRNLKSWT